MTENPTVFVADSFMQPANARGQRNLLLDLPSEILVGRVLTPTPRGGGGGVINYEDLSTIRGVLINLLDDYFF
jgi:hypothetical protein